MNYGQSEERSGKTPTLRQYLKQSGGKHPNSSRVKRIFVPNKYENYSFVTDHDFRVTANSGSTLYDFLESDLDGIIEREECLSVWLDDASKFQWSLQSDDSYRTEWTRDDYGFVNAGTQKRSVKQKPKQ